MWYGCMSCPFSLPCTGVGLGLESTALPVLVMSAALIASYWLGNTSGACTCGLSTKISSIVESLISRGTDMSGSHGAMVASLAFAPLPLHATVVMHSRS